MRRRSRFLAGALLLAAAGLGVAWGVSRSGHSSAPKHARSAAASTAPGSPSISTSTSTSTSSSTSSTSTAATTTATTGSRTPGGLQLPKRKTPLIVGVVEISAVQQPDPAPARELARIHNAGFDALILSARWRRGHTTLASRDAAILHRGVDAAKKAGVRVFLIVDQGGSRDTPRSSGDRAQFTAFAANVARAFPDVHEYIVGNEPNLNGFWLPQFSARGGDAAASAYEAVLARVYDALKGVSNKNEVIGGALAPHGSDNPALKRATHSPARFLQDLGAFYRGSHRTRPIMDAIALHPYLIRSSTPPAATHPHSSTITLGDYPKLVSILGHAFGGTAQHGRDLPVYYTEFGIQTTVPPAERRFYQSRSAPGKSDVVSPATQGRYYREAIELAFCQPTVRGFFIFHTIDEPDLRGWQSGLYYFDRRPKSSLGVVRKVAHRAEHGLVLCVRG